MPGFETPRRYLGPMPSSGVRTLFERATPAKKKFFSTDGVRQAAHAITGTAVSAATYCLKIAVLFFLVTCRAKDSSASLSAARGKGQGSRP